jgi:hypothetical protein
MPLLLVKEMSPFARAVTEIFKFFFGKVTFGPPCILTKVKIRFGNHNMYQSWSGEKIRR